MKAMNKFLILLGYALLMPFLAKGDDLARADSAYMQNRFDDAAALYEQAMVKEGVSAGLLYNLGNTYYRLGKDGEAMVCYERARKLDPGNALINGNLQFLSSRVLEANKGSLMGKPGNVEPDHETFLDTLYRMIAVERSSNGWAVFAVMAFILFLGAMAMYVFTPNVLARKTGFFSSIAFLIFTVAFLIFGYLGAGQYTRDDEAILVEFTTQLLEQPVASAKPATTPLHKGTKLKILETKKGADGTEWLRVKLNAENAGWIKKQSIEII